MSRHLIGWMLATTVIATALDGSALAGNDEGGTDCVEIATVPDSLILDNGKVLLLLPSSRQGLKGPFQFGSGTPETPDRPVVMIIDPSGHVVPAPATTVLPWPSLPVGELLPDGEPPRTSIGAACGVPEGLTLAVPASPGSNAA